MATEHGLNRFDPQSSTFTVHSLPIDDPDVTYLMEGPGPGEKNYLYVNTADDGIFGLDLTTYEADNDLDKALLNVLGTTRGTYCLDTRSILWKSVRGSGIKGMNVKTGEEVQFKWDNSISGIVPRLTVNAIIEDPVNGNLYLGTSANGIFILDKSSMTVRKANGKRIKSCRINALEFKTETISGPSVGRHLYVGTEDQGLQLYDILSEDIVQMDRSNIPFQTDRMKVRDILIDRQGTIWLAVYQRGIMEIPNSVYGFTTHTLNSDHIPGINTSEVDSFAEDVELGVTYVGTDGDGLYLFSGDDIYTNLNTGNSNLKGNFIQSLEMDGNGKLWVGTFFNKLQWYTPENGFVEFKDNDKFRSRVIWSMKYSKQSNVLYVGTLYEGLFIVDPETDSLIGKVESYSETWCRTMFVDRNDILWIGSTNGPFYYDPTTGVAKEFNVGANLQKRPVYAICESSDGSMWFGFREGLLQSSRDGVHQRLWTVKDGMSSNVIKGIVEGPDHKLWVTTMDGITLIDMEKESISVFHEEDGLQGNEFRGSAVFLSSKNRLYFGGSYGLTTCYPNLISLNRNTVENLHISSLKIMGEDVSYDPAKGKDNLLPCHLHEAENIILPRGSNVITLSFSTMEFVSSHRIMLEYKMSGEDRDWNTTRLGEVINYSHIKPGKHILTVKAYYDGESQNPYVKDFNIVLKAPWYMTGWAILCYSSLLLTCIFFFLRLRKQRLLARKEKQDAQNNAMRLEMYSNLTHEIRTPLFLVMSPLKKLREGEGDTELKDTYNLMYRNGLRINRLVNQITDMRKADEGKMKLNFKKTDIYYFISDIVKSFDNLSQSKRINISVNCSPDEYLWVDQGNFDKVIFNVLSNAFKFTTDGGDIRIDIIKAIAGFVDIKIFNSSSHIDEKDLSKIFERFYQSSNSGQKVGSGIGLSLAKMLVELQHGKIWAENTDNGVTFTIRMPSGKNHLTEEELAETDHHKDLYTTKTLSYGEIKDEPDYEDGPFFQSDKESKNKRNIIIIDDDPDTRRYLHLSLNTYNVSSFKNGEEAWESIMISCPDAVITDLTMDEMNGYELCRKIKSNPVTCHIPVIILTSADDENSEQRCSDIGADKFYVKPVSTSLLTSGVAQVIATRDILRQKATDLDSPDYGSITLTAYDEQLKAKIINAVNDNISTPEFDVKNLSELVGISRVHLNRKMKELMGTSPSVYIRNIRLKQAAYLLLNCDKPNISETAYKVGYTTQSYFSTAFHDYFGLSPSDFIAKYSNNKESVNHLF